MNTQTERPVRRPTNQRGKAARNSKRYSKQTAHVSARRDGKPLIFGWGKNLSHTEKIQFQRRATIGLAAFIGLVLVAILVGAWINLNIIVPGLAITTVNGHDIPQSQYRQMVAVRTQLELNKLYGPNGLTAQVTNLEKQDAPFGMNIANQNKKISDLKDQISKLPPGDSPQRTDLNNQLNAANKQLDDLNKNHQDLQNQISTLNQQTIPLEKQTFTQSQLGNESATWLQDDELIREWLTTQPQAVQNKINPTATQINKDFNSLKANMPTNNGYNTLLSGMGISDDQVRAALTIIDRRDNAQNYISATFFKSPAYQVLARQMILPTKQDADKELQKLQQGQDFGKLASTDSKDTLTNTKGGDLGWMTRYQYIDASANSVTGPENVETWMFDPTRKLNEISPVIFGNGSYYIVQIMNIDPARAVDSTVLKALQSNALVDWLQGRRALPGQSITTANQTMMFDPNNLPPNNLLPSSAPSMQTTPTAPVDTTTPPADTTTPAATATAGQ